MRSAARLLRGRACLPAHDLPRSSPLEAALPALVQAQRCLGTTTGRTSSSDGTSSSAHRRPWVTAGAVALAAAAAATAATASTSTAKAAETGTKGAPGSRPGLPTIPRSEVAKHGKGAERVWVTYRDGVFDITDFVAVHPGGARILMAAGGAIDPYWNMYAVHKSAATLDLLGGYRIGNLPASEVMSDALFDDPYANDPKRDPALRVQSQTPFNAETPPTTLREHFLTPTHLHFKRQHLPVPDVQPAAYELQILGDGVADDGISMTLDDVKKLPSKTVTMTMQCAGNRRLEMSLTRAVRGLSWNQGAISTATWTGVPLRELLRAQGVDLEAALSAGVKHVQMEGLDADAEGARYAASIPIEKALAPDGDVIVAWEMNGEPLTRDHGYPLRVIVPGNVAARSVKWVNKIILSEDESDSHWQQEDYKGFCPDEDWENLDWSKAPAIQEMPVTSAILWPEPGAKLPAGAKEVEVEGYAFAGGGRNIVRVDVSVDGGKSWRPAELKGDSQPYRRAWAWRKWSIQVPVPAGADGSTLEFICKAVDDGYNVQPETFAPIYNMRGVLSNAWHRMKVEVPKA